MCVLINGTPSLRLVRDKPVRLSPRATVVFAVALLIAVMQPQTVRAQHGGGGWHGGGWNGGGGAWNGGGGNDSDWRGGGTAAAGAAAGTAAAAGAATGTVAAAGTAAVPGMVVAGTKAGTVAVTAGGGWSRALAGTLTTRRSTPILTPTRTHRPCLRYPIGIIARILPVTTLM